MIGAFLEELSEAIHPGDTALNYLKSLGDLQNQFKDEPLPTSREEFEARP